MQNLICSLMGQVSNKEAYTQVLMQYERGLIASIHMSNEYVRLIETYNDMLDKENNTLKECE